MSERTQYLNAIPEGTLIMVKGRLKYSRLAKKIEGDALKKAIERDKRMNKQYITTVPYTTATICDAQLVGPVSNEVNAYMGTRLFQSSSEGYTGYCFSIDNKGNLPWVATRQQDGSVHQEELTSELANDQIVTLILNVFGSQNYGNHGLGLAGVIVESPTIAYYAGGLESQLKAMGIVFDKPLVAQESLNHVIDTAPADNASELPPVTPPAAGTDAFTSAQQQSMPAYAYPTYQQPQVQPQMNNVPFPAQAQPVPQTAAPVPNPTGFQGSESGGIRYEAMDRQYD